MEGGGGAGGGGDGGGGDGGGGDGGGGDGGGSEGGGGDGGGGGGGGGLLGLLPIFRYTFESFPLVKFKWRVGIHLVIPAKLHPVKRKRSKF